MSKDLESPLGYLTVETSNLSRIREALYKVDGLSHEQVDGVLRQVEPYGRREMLRQLNITLSQSPTMRVEFYRSVYYSFGLQEALISGGNLDDSQRIQFGDKLLFPDK